MNGTKTFFAMVFMLLAVTAFAVAAEQNESNDIEQEKILNNSMQVRYEHLECKIVFTNDQIVLLNEYLPEDNGLMVYKEILEDDLNELKDLLDERNRTVFDDYITDTLRPDLVNATQALNNVKKDFRKYNITVEHKEEIKNMLKALKDNYSACISDKARKIAEIHKKHYELTDYRWQNIIRNMNKLNISTEQLEEIRALLQDQEQRLDDAIETGNQTFIREVLAQIRAEHQHLWANFEISRLNGYMNKIGPMAEKYGMGEKMNQMRQHLSEMENYTAQGHKFKEGEGRMVWQELRDTSMDMREASKEILKQRVQEQKDLREANKNMNNGSRGRK